MIPTTQHPTPAERECASSWSAILRMPPTWILLGGAALRVWYWIGARPLWLDEEMIALNVRDRSLLGLAGPLWLDQGAPLGWLAAERLMALVFGLSEIAMRALPIALGIGTLGVAWWVGRRWMSSAAAAVFVFLVAAGEWIVHYSLELKHYSADTLFGLLLPALVVWAIEGGDRRERLRRAAIWWVVAAAGEWLSMGGLLAAPACALILWIQLWRRDGRKSADRVVAYGLGWLAVFLLHYWLSLRFTTSNAQLWTLWADSMAPATGVIGRVGWLLQQAVPLAQKPAGSGLGWVFWGVAAAGLLLARSRILGAVLAAVPASACLLAMARVVPVGDRLSLWALPAVYAGVALAIDAALQHGRRGLRRREPARISAAALVGATALVVCANIGFRAYVNVPVSHPLTDNHGLDDRAGVRWLFAQRRADDAIVTSRLGQPAVWWYGNVSIDATARGGMVDSAPVFVVSYHSPHPNCEDELARALQGSQRALVYLGFRFDDLPAGFDDLFFKRLGRLGHVEAYRQFAGESVTAIVDLAPLGERPSGVVPMSEPPGSLDGCLGMEPGSRW